MTILPAQVLLASAAGSRQQASSVTCNGQKYIDHGLIGFGYTPSNDRDSFGDTARGLGSSIAIDVSRLSTARCTLLPYYRPMLTLADENLANVNFHRLFHRVQSRQSLRGRPILTARPWMEYRGHHERKYPNTKSLKTSLPPLFLRALADISSNSSNQDFTSSTSPCN